jgi:hypothetical protein
MKLVSGRLGARLDPSVSFDRDRRIISPIPQQQPSSPLEIREQGGPGLRTQRHLERLGALAAAEDEHAPREVGTLDPQ